MADTGGVLVAGRDTRDATGGGVEPPLTVCERRSGWQLVDWRELWRYRELLYFLIWRDVKVRYKQTLLGAAWAVLQPFATMVVFSLFFSRMAAAPSSRVPYPLFVFAGLLPWTFFANAVGSAASSVVGNQSLVTKVFFPRLIIPFAAVGAGLVDFAVGFVMLLGMMVYYGVAPGWGLLFTPVLTLGLLLAALGVGTLLSALTVAYRDVKHVIPFMIQLWMFATPAIYLQSGTAVDPRWRFLLDLNPAYGLIVNFRNSVFGDPLRPNNLAVCAAVILVTLGAGLFYFRRVEAGFADII